MNFRDLIGKILLAMILIPCPRAEAGPSLSGSAHQEVFASPAEKQEKEELTLLSAVDLALRHNPLIRAAISGRKIADGQLGEARAGRFPLLQFSETFTRSNNPVFVFGSLLEQSRFGPQNFDTGSLNSPEPLNNFRTAITVRLPLFDQLETGTRIDQAIIGQKQADLQKEMIEQQVRFEVLRAYYGILIAQARKEVTEEAVHMAEADVRRIRDMFTTGLVVRADLLATEVQAAEFRQQRVQATGEAITALALLDASLGLPGKTSRKVSGRLGEKIFDVSEPDELIRLALLHRPDYLRASYTVRSTEKRIRGARGQYLPKVDLFSTYGASGRDLTSGSADYALGAGLTYNLFDPGRGARIDQARAARALAGVEQEHLANRIRLEIIQAHQQFVTARERLVLAVQTVGQAQEALRIVQDRYREGLTIITELLRAETAFVRSRLNLLAARYDYYIGYALVLLASGRLTDVQPFVS